MQSRYSRDQYRYTFFIPNIFIQSMIFAYKKRKNNKHNFHFIKTHTYLYTQEKEKSLFLGNFN